MTSRVGRERRAGAWFGVLGLLASLTAVITPVVAAAPASPAAAATASPYGPTVTIVGHGFGHGEGLSQVGAYGYATHFAWSWPQILGHYYGGTTLGTLHAGDQTMTVRLTALDGAAVTSVVASAPVLQVNGGGAYQSVTAIPLGAPGPVTYSVFGLPATTGCGTATTNYATWLPIGVGAASVDITTTNGSAPVLCQPDGHTRAYRGALRTVADANSTPRTVNIVNVEDYVRGVVPRESPASWADDAGGKGIEALRAQAVAARTYGLAEHRYSYAKTCDTQDCQVYGGAALDAKSLEDARTDRATADTAGTVIYTAQGNYANAMFSASSGGYTAGNVFPAVVDDGDAFSPLPDRHDWSNTVNTAAIEAAYPGIGTLQSLVVTKRNGLGDWGGRVLNLTVRGSTGAANDTGNGFRSKLNLRSDWFNVGSACGGRLIPLEDGAVDPPPARFTPVTPARLLDTRIGLGGSAGVLAAGCTVAVQVAGAGGVPANGATAAALNLTATQAGGEGFLTVYPCGTPRPNASNLNMRADRDVANLVTAPLGDGGQICIYTLTDVHVVVDVLGWYGPQGASAFTARQPTRLLDTRSGLGAAKPGAVAGHAVQRLHVVGAGGVPAQGVSAVALNVTSTETTANGYVTVWPCDAAQPTASNLNYKAGTNVANQVLVGVGASGDVCLSPSSTGHLVVDVLGSFASTGALYDTLASQRIVDTRSGQGAPQGPLRSHQVLRLHVAGTGGIPASGVSAVALNVTVDAATIPGFVTVFDCDGPLPVASNLNYANGQRAANLATVPLAADGSVCIYTNGSTQLIVDTAGWFPA